MCFSTGILTSLVNRGPNRKGYKMRCLQMPLFWFVSSTNEIKRIRDKIFCFDIRLGPNPRIQQITRIHQVGCNSTKLREIRMSEVPQVLLEKRATTGSLSKNLFCQLQAKGKWLTILESLKKENKHGQWPQPSTKRTRCSYKLKRIYICGVHLGLLTQTFPGGCCLWVVFVSILIFLI